MCMQDYESILEETWARSHLANKLSDLGALWVRYQPRREDELRVPECEPGNPMSSELAPCEAGNTWG